MVVEVREGPRGLLTKGERMALETRLRMCAKHKRRVVGPTGE